MMREFDEWLARLRPRGRATNKLQSAKKDARRLLFVTAGLKGPTSGGGIATVFHSMVKTLGHSEDVSVDVLYAAHPYYASKEKYAFWRDVFKKDCNVNLIPLETPKDDYGSKEMKRSYAILRYLIERHADYGVVVFHDFGGLGYYPLLFQKLGLGLHNMRIVLSAHGNHTLSSHFGMKALTAWPDKVAAFMERRCYELADEITSPSEFYREWIADRFSVAPSKFSIIPNILFKFPAGVKPVQVTFANPSLRLVVFYGRMERLKGIDIFIEAIKLIASTGESVNVLFAGLSTTIDGVSAAEYIGPRLADMPGEVKFEFNCYPADFFAYVREKNGTCVFPTLGENAPCVVIEAALYKVRFVASDLPGIREELTEEAQEKYLFRTGSARDLSAALLADAPCPDESSLTYSMDEAQSMWTKFLDVRIQKSPASTRTRHVTREPTISVVIPTCDRPELLGDTLASIAAQSFRAQEVIVVDDGSQKESSVENKRVCDRYGADYVPLPHKRYKGAASNIGARRVTAEYICFFDDDDIAYPGMLRRYATALSGSPETDIFSGFVDCFEHANSGGGEPPPIEYASLTLGGGVEVNGHINFFGKGSFVINAGAFHRIGGYEVDDGPVPMVDYRFYIKAALVGLHVGLIPVAQYMYRKHSPHSLFYTMADPRASRYKAKQSMLDLYSRYLGQDVGLAMRSFVWDVNLPALDKK